MNRVFDYNGSLVAPSKPVRTLRTVKKTLHIDSADRDVQKYYTNGDVVYYLPRVYENVVSIRLKSATFPRLDNTGSGPGALTHQNLTTMGQIGGPNIPSGNFSTDSTVPSDGSAKYFVIEIDGLNKTDETTVGATRSTYPDSFFAKIPVNLVDCVNNVKFINYNDNTEEENIAKYSPPIGKLDRLRIITRLHNQQGKIGFMYWTGTGSYPNPPSVDDVLDAKAQYSLTFEIEYLDNVFDDFSSFETRIGDRADGFSRQA